MKKELQVRNGWSTPGDSPRTSSGRPEGSSNSGELEKVHGLKEVRKSWTQRGMQKVKEKIHLE